MTDKDNIVRERLAAVQHDVWSHWMRYLFSVCQINPDGSVTIPADKAERWQRQVQTKYTQLSDTEKESDRHQADKVMAILQPSVVPGNYITRNGMNACVWEVRQVKPDIAEYFSPLLAGDSYLAGTVDGGGMNHWFLDGTDSDGNRAWDLIEFVNPLP